MKKLLLLSLLLTGCMSEDYTTVIIMPKRQPVTDVMHGHPMKIQGSVYVDELYLG